MAIPRMLGNNNLATSSDQMVVRQVNGLDEAIAQHVLKIARDPSRTIAEKAHELRVISDKMRAAYKEIQAQTLIP